MNRKLLREETLGDYTLSMRVEDHAYVTWWTHPSVKPVGRSSYWKTLKDAEASFDRMKHEIAVSTACAALGVQLGASW